MPVEKAEKKSIELWKGQEAVLKRPELLKDYDFINELNKAQRTNDFDTIVSMLFVLVGGEEVFNKVREHIIDEKGFFDIDDLKAILEKIWGLFPKAQSPAQPRW